MEFICEKGRKEMKKDMREKINKIMMTTFWKSGLFESMLCTPVLKVSNLDLQ